MWDRRSSRTISTIHTRCIIRARHRLQLQLQAIRWYHFNQLIRREISLIIRRE